MPEGKPAFILFVQSFGGLVTWQPHIYALVANGVFQDSGVFRVLPPISTAFLELELCERVIAFLKEKGCIDDALIEQSRACK